MNIPDTLSKDTNFEKYIISTHKENKSSFAQAFHIIGSNQDGSLFNAINKLMPIFFLPQNILKSIIIKGESGSGKKYIELTHSNECGLFFIKPSSLLFLILS